MTDYELIEHVLAVWYKSAKIPTHRMADVITVIREHDASRLAMITPNTPNATTKRVPTQIVACDTTGLLALSNDGFIYQAEWDGAGYKWTYRVDDLPQG